MKTKTIGLLTLLTVLTLMTATIPALASLNYDHPTKAPNGPKGRSNTAHLYLVEKDPNDWTIVDDGAWGKMKYASASDEFEYLFNGHGLEPETEYSLIYYGNDTVADDWPYATCIDSGTSDSEGNLHLKGSHDFGYNLPISESEDDEAKIWLVLSEDIDAELGQMTGWNPEEYLFEYDVITYDDTDVS